MKGIKQFVLIEMIRNLKRAKKLVSKRGTSEITVQRCQCKLFCRRNSAGCKLGRVAKKEVNVGTSIKSKCSKVWMEQGYDAGHEVRTNNL